MLTKDDDIIEVCSEETMNEILDRYMPSNEHSASYTWKRLGRPLDMEVTLEDNDIPDETAEFIDLHIDEDAYIACVHLYYNDDLTVAWKEITAIYMFKLNKILNLLLYILRKIIY